MGRHKSNKSLVQQVKERLDSKLAIGESKYLAKLVGNRLVVSLVEKIGTRPYRLL